MKAEKSSPRVIRSAGTKKVHNSLNGEAIQYQEKRNSRKNLKDFAFLSFYHEQKGKNMRNFQFLIPVAVGADQKYFLVVKEFTTKKELKTFDPRPLFSAPLRPAPLYGAERSRSHLLCRSGPKTKKNLKKSLNLFKTFDFFQNTFDIIQRSRTDKNFLFFKKISKTKEFCFFLFFEVLFLFFSFFQKFQFFFENLVLNFLQSPAKHSVKNSLSVQNTRKNFVDFFSVLSKQKKQTENFLFSFFCFLFFVFRERQKNQKPWDFEKKFQNSSQLINWKKRKSVKILNFQSKIFIFQKSFLFVQVFLQNFEKFFYSFCFFGKKSMFNKFLFENVFSNIQKFPLLFFEKKLKKKKSFFSYFGFSSFFISTLFSSSFTNAPSQTNFEVHVEESTTKKENKNFLRSPVDRTGKISSFFFQKFSFCFHEKKNFFSQRTFCIPTLVNNLFFSMKTIQTGELFFKKKANFSFQKNFPDIFSEIALQKSFFHIFQSFQSFFFERLQNTFFWTSLKNILSKSSFLFQPKKICFFLKQTKEQRIQPFLFFEYKNFFFFSNEKKNLCSFCISFFENLIFTKSSLLGFLNFKNFLNNFENFFETFMKIHGVFQKEFLVEIFKKEKLQNLFQNFLFLNTFFFFENFCFQNQAFSFSLDVPYGGIIHKEKKAKEDLFFKKNGFLQNQFAPRSGENQKKKKRGNIKEKVDFPQLFDSNVQKENIFFPKKSSFLSIKTQNTKVSQCCFFFSLFLFFYNKHFEKYFQQMKFVQFKKSFFHFTFKNSLFFLFFRSNELFQNLFSLEKTPSRASLKNHFNECKTVLDQAKGKTQLFLMKKLQKKISNWCKKHKNNFSPPFLKKRMFQNKEIFEYCDFILFKFLWNWAKKKHPNKSKQWIQKKYFHLISKKKWVFGKRIGKYLICLNLHSQI
jgi:hypothetical protein